MFRNLNIWSKFAAVLSVPLVGLLTLVGLGVARSVDVVVRSNQTQNVATFLGDVAALTNALQLERFVTGVYLDGGYSVPIERLQRQWPVSDQAAATVRDHSADLELAAQSPLDGALRRSFADLGKIATLRAAVRNDKTDRKKSEGVYLDAVGNLADVRLLAEDATRQRLTTIAGGLKDTADRTMLYYSVAVIVILGAAIGISLPMANAMVRSLHRLRDTSLQVAQHGLPDAVARLQHARSVDELAVPSQPVAVEARDEIGQVAIAFNTVHTVAMRTAVEQGALRRSIGDMFTNLARRSQSLLDRQIKLIDELERAADDPESLDSLFQLDHLATRMRRNAENLLVLSGTEPARRWGTPVGLQRVVRAAIAEVEDYTRVELLGLADVQVVGRAVGDVVHLLAELIENATSFSPPTTRVRIAGEAAARGYVLEIEDAGIGMTDDELIAANQRLADPPMIEFALDKMLGFFVVGRLAQRHGLKVELRRSWYGGVTALVLLPEQVLVRDPAAATPARDPVEEAARRPVRQPAPDLQRGPGAA